MSNETVDEHKSNDITEETAESAVREDDQSVEERLATAVDETITEEEKEALQVIDGQLINLVYDDVICVDAVRSTDAGPDIGLQPSDVKQFDSVAMAHDDFVNAVDGKNVGKTSCDDKPADKSTDKPTEDINPDTQTQEFKDATNKFIKDVEAQVKDLKDSGISLHITPEDYMTISNKPEDIFAMFYRPNKPIESLNMDGYINATTKYDYKPYDSPNLKMAVDMAHRVLYMEALNKIFKHQIFDTSKTEFQFSDIDVNIARFIQSNPIKKSTNHEYDLFTSAMSRLLMALTTTTEQAFRMRYDTIGTDFKYCVKRDLQVMTALKAFGDNEQSVDEHNDKPCGLLEDALKHGLTRTNIANKIWTTFVSILLSINDNYKDVNVNDLHTIPNDQYNKWLNNNAVYRRHNANGVNAMAILLAMILRKTLPSIALNYFHIMKSIILVIKLVSVYIDKQLWLNKTVEERADDLHVIAKMGDIIYENLAHMYKLMPRSLPMFKEELSEQTKMYIINHMVNGGQYFILKEFTRTLPCLAECIDK